MAIRVMRTASALPVHTAGIYQEQDRQAVHRFNADESDLAGVRRKPLAALAGR